MENLELRIMENFNKMEKAINERKVTKTINEFEVTYKPKTIPNQKIECSADVYEILKSLWSDKIGHIEEFNVLTLNRANLVTGFFNASKGGVSGTVVDIKVILQHAILTNASSIIVAHNHPSGTMKASSQDLKMTENLKNACKVMEIGLLDHIIMSPFDTYLSFANEGLI